MKFQFGNVFRILVAVPLTAVSFFAPSSFAGGERCAGLFVNADFKNEIKASETHRLQMLSFVQQMQTEIRLQMKARVATFDRGVLLRSKIREADIQRYVKTSPMLSQFEMAQLETGPVSGRIKPPTLDMEKPLDSGYFEWLKHNSLEFKLVHQGELFKDGNYRPTVSQVEPLDLLRRYMEEGLSLDLSLKLVQAKLDPTLPNEAREAAQSLRHLTALDKAIEQQVLPFLGIRFSVIEANEAWRAFTSLSEARSTLMKLLETQVEKHGSRLGRNDFERLVLALADQPGYFNPMVRYFEMSGRGALSPAALAELANYLGEMKAHLRLSPKMELGDLSLVLNYLLPNPSAHSYESLLAVTYSPSGSVIPDQVMTLRKIIEIAESLKTRESTLDYVESLVPPPRTP